MSTLEVRRHSHRKAGGGSQLSQEGVEFARTVGASMGPFNTVATSVVPRSRETAVAMGFAVDLELITLSTDRALYLEASASRWWLQREPFSALAEIVRQDSAYGRYANSMAALWRDLLTPLPAHGAALVIGHSGELEAALVACFPGADHSSWGRTFGPCEGARLSFEGEPPHFSDIEFIRFPEFDATEIVSEITREINNDVQSPTG